MDNIKTWLAATGYDLVVRPKHEAVPPAQREVAAPREDLYKRSMMERTN
jgi:hypothetical protein